MLRVVVVHLKKEVRREVFPSYGHSRLLRVDHGLSATQTLVLFNQIIIITGISIVPNVGAQDVLQ